MLRSFKELRSYDLQATDGKVGSVKDAYFDDREWIIRYFVVDTGGWILGRKVLLAPEVFEKPDVQEQEFRAPRLARMCRYRASMRRFCAPTIAGPAIGTITRRLQPLRHSSRRSKPQSRPVPNLRKPSRERLKRAIPICAAQRK